MTRKKLVKALGAAIAGAELGAKSPEPRPTSAIEQHVDGDIQCQHANKLDEAFLEWQTGKGRAAELSSMVFASELARPNSKAARDSKARREYAFETDESTAELPPNVVLPEPPEGHDV